MKLIEMMHHLPYNTQNKIVMSFIFIAMSIGTYIALTTCVKV